jgi:RNA polymerase sigma-70 factor (sigma-E family)
VRIAEVAVPVRSSFGDGFEAYAVADMPRLTRLASMLTRNADAARDLVQETLVRVGVAWERIDRDGNPAGYANTTMSRLAWRQDQRRRTELSLLSRHRPVEEVSAEFARVDDASQLGQAMTLLGARQRAVLVLRFYCDLSEAEVARSLGCSAGTVKSQTARGLANLRRHLTEIDASPDRTEA